jgi:hypothetical protein
MPNIVGCLQRRRPRPVVYTIAYVRQAVSAVVGRGSITGRGDAISPRVIQREVAIPILCEVIAHTQVKRTGLRERRAYDGIGCCRNTVYINFPRLGGVI